MDGYTWTPGVRACPMCGKPEHGSIACEWAAGWPVVAQPQPPNDHEILLNEVREIKAQLSDKLDAEQLQGELNELNRMLRLAWDLWCDAFFTGSFEEWLEYLRTESGGTLRAKE